MSGKEKKVQQPQPSLKELKQDIQRLTKQIEQYSNACQYTQAAAAYDEMLAKQKKYKEVQMKELTEKHDNDSVALNKAYEYLQEQFKIYWDEEMKQFNADSQKQQHDLEVCFNFLFFWKIGYHFLDETL